MAMRNFCSGLLLSMFLSLVPAFGDTNVLVNPGFENGTDGWEGRGCKIEAVTTPVHSGAKSVKAFDRTETWQGVKQSLIGKVANGKTYKISGWVRLENSDADTVTISIEQTDDNGTRYMNIANGAGSNTEWVELSGDFTPSASGTLKTLDVYFEGPAQDVNFFVDDVSITGPSPDEAVQAEPNAPKTEPNAPKKDTNEAAAPQAKANISVEMMNEVVIGRQQQ